jgi:hypothetical protein
MIIRTYVGGHVEAAGNEENEEETSNQLDDKWPGDRYTHTYLMRAEPEKMPIERSVVDCNTLKPANYIPSLFSTQLRIRA